MQMHYGVKTLPDRCSKHPTLSLVQVFVTTESVQMYNCLALIINIECTLLTPAFLLLPPPILSPGALACLPPSGAVCTRSRSDGE